MKLLLAFMLIPSMVLGQSGQFKILGRFEFYNHQKIAVETAVTALNDSAYVDCFIKKDKALPFNIVSVENNRFEVEVKYPTPFQISFFDEKEATVSMSDIFFVEPTTIRINVNDLRKSDNLGNQLTSTANQEYQKLREHFKHLPLDDNTRQVKDIALKEAILQKYIKKHPDSYVAMWVLIMDYVNTGYDESMYKNSAFFSHKIKNTLPFKTFIRRINIDRNLLPGSIFPFARYNFGDKLSETLQKNKYTLIDFWASYCKPCIRQHPALSQLNTDFGKNGFAIYGISIDLQESKQKMQAIIQKSKLVWPNYHDANGEQSKKINIYQIPTNFVLDTNGKVIFKDITMEELRKFLIENQ